VNEPARVARMDVVIVNFNAREHLRACLAAVEADDARAVVVVDASSSDGSAQMVSSNHPSVRLVEAPNLGYGALANRGIAETDARYLLLLNSDAVLRPGSVRALAAYLDAVPRAGMAGPRLLDPDGRLQPSCYPLLTPVQILLTMTPLSELLGRTPWIRDRHLPTSGHEVARQVPWVKGAALAIRRRAFDDVGGFDEAFFMYYEELDLAYRMREAGWEVHFTPSATVVHHGGASTSQRREEMTVELYESLLRFHGRRHRSRREPVGVRLALLAVVTGKLVERRLRALRTSDLSRQTELEADLRALRRTLVRIRTGRGA
jgi:N-acetylglucosaminyl-diphospho-decaprenol L-rhamnosyltransferase